GPAGLGSASPRTPRSFDVLNLLAHLLDQDLELERYLGDLGVHGLRAQRVGLAMQLLSQEVQALARAAALRQYPPYFGDVGGQPCDLLRDVHFCREQRKLLLEPLLIGIEAGLAQARAEPLDIRRMQRGHARRDARDLRLDAVAARVEDGAQFRALARPRRREVAQRGVDQLRHARGELVRG